MIRRTVLSLVTLLYGIWLFPTSAVASTADPAAPSLHMYDHLRDYDEPAVVGTSERGPPTFATTPTGSSRATAPRTARPRTAAIVAYAYAPAARVVVATTSRNQTALDTRTDAERSRPGSAGYVAANNDPRY